MAETKKKKPALGKGLEALFGDMSTPVSTESAKKAQGKDNSEEKDGIISVSLDRIKPNAMQPRKVFDEEDIESLADSITEHGVIMPVMLKKSGKGYEIVAGERRWRAARKAGLKEVPAIIRDLSAEENALFAIIENMQRVDLNPLEEANAFKNVMDNFGFTQEAVAKSVGKSRPYVANTLRLLKLPPKIQEYISQGSLSAGHANALGQVRDAGLQETLAAQIVREGLSVREAEAAAAKIASGGSAKKKKAKAREKSRDVQNVEEELTSLFGTRVTLGSDGRKGVIEIHYYSRDELDGLIDVLRKAGEK
jgi:ParB family chromosome partitioning protein